ncbi:helix-turn-helix transcriptional regulator [Dickeya oryzae]|uniref:helix-turn-helix domain-containing protein n=1 Tax=Dickeya oryzae TaxID=1240404 RepID=UPI001AECFA16|nr:helix-turn-helix transcriptional regulator [Dickeya oryzae]MBP2845809.1 helix-turn-helix transcriptional regulator [Dickeya oryzae]
MVPKRLKEAREAAGMTQELLSQAINVGGINSRSRLSSYEVGRTEPPFSLVMKIAKVLDYPEGYFYTIDDAFAATMLEAHRNRENAELNSNFNDLVDKKKMAAQLEEARKLVRQLSEALNS